MAICGKCHKQNVTIEHVRECFSIAPGVKIRVRNFAPEGPARPRPLNERAKEELRMEEHNTLLFRAGKPHGFTQRCPECIAGTHNFSGTTTKEPERQENFRRNKFGGKCQICGAFVPEEEGKIEKVAGKWLVYHIGECPPRAEKEEEKPFPNIPAGYYAVESRTGNNDLDFFMVVRPEKGYWKERTFVKLVIGGHPNQPVRGSEARSVLERIEAAGIQEAKELYGKEIGKCGECNRSLTDEESRRIGIGPVCRNK